MADALLMPGAPRLPIETGFDGSWELAFGATCKSVADSLTALATEPAMVDALAEAIVNALAPGRRGFRDRQACGPCRHLGLHRWRRPMRPTIADRLKAHIAAGYQPAARGIGPHDDTLELALAEERGQVVELRRRVRELERERPRC
jgi:hypothetical protein